MEKTKKIDGLTLKDFKDMERETIAAKLNAQKALLASTVLLNNIEDGIIGLDGKTADQEYEESAKDIKKSLAMDTTGDVDHV